MRINLLKSTCLLLTFLSFSFYLKAQQQNLYLNNDYNRAIERALIKSNKTFHSTSRPFIQSSIDSLITIDSVARNYFNTTKERGNNFILRKLTQEHLFQYADGDLSLFIDPVFDFSIGKEIHFGSVYTNTRGFQFGGNIGTNFSFYTAIYENWSKFPTYLNNYIKDKRVVPGQSFARIKNGSVDYGVPYGYVSYSPNKYFNFQLGQGKNFFGDGYRSLFLSDGTYSYPYFKITTTFWKIKYTNLWTQFMDISKGFKTGPYPKKYASYQFLSYQPNQRLNINLFQAIVWSPDTTGKRGIEWAYLNPLIYLNTLNFNMGSPDNSLMGIGFNYQLFKNHKFYGQFLIDDFNLGNLTKNSGSYFQEKYAYQLGWKYFDAFNINNLYFQTEFNRSRPYVYANKNPEINYTHLNEPIAHPLGANFNEVVAIGTYKIKKVELSMKLNLAKYGADTANSHWGKDIFKSDFDSQYGELSYGNYTGQGLKTTLTNLQAQIAYLLNPKTNMKIEIGANKRIEKNEFIDSKSTYFTIGIKTAINNLYYDF